MRRRIDGSLVSTEATAAQSSPCFDERYSKPRSIRGFEPSGFLVIELAIEDLIEVATYARVDLLEARH